MIICNMPCSIGSIIPVFLFIMFTGAVLIYLNFKITDIKREVDKQNKILLSFISDIKTNMVNKQGKKFPGETIGGESYLASDGALDFVHKIVEGNTKCGVPGFDGSGHILFGCGNSSKEVEILSSDDSDSGDSSEDDDTLIIEVSDVEIPVSDTVSLPILNDVIQSVGMGVGVGLAVDDGSISDIAPITLTTTMTSEVTDFGNMKVEQLRKIVLESQLAPQKEINKMKKPELLALMSRNNNNNNNNK